MTYDDLCRKYGNGNRAAKALRISRKTVSTWKARGGIPFASQFAIQQKTRGRLKADVSALSKRFS